MDYREFNSNPDCVLADPSGYIAAAAQDPHIGSGAKLAQKALRRLSDANRLLAGCPQGARLVFVGDCPSGNTYDAAPEWDGSAEARQAVLRAVIRKTSFNAWDARLNLESAESQGIQSASLRTGRF